jgi:D-lactate dehydrogenase
MTFVTPAGTVVNTAQQGADTLLQKQEPQLHAGLLKLRQRILASDDAVHTIRQQFSMKNTMGYGLNSFLDYEEPVKILEHLMVGSEGTLGFVAEAVFRTIEVLPHVATGLLVFPDLVSAANAVPELVRIDSSTVELMDATSLRVAQRSGDAPAQIAELQVEEHAALLVEYQGRDLEELTDKTAIASALFTKFDLSVAPALTTDSVTRAALWHVRKGLYASVAGNRPAGSNALLEDVVVPVDDLGETCRELTELFNRFGYEDSVIFGHAKDGNIHFMLNERFDDAGSLERYERFTETLVELILGRKGSLKAEHGTGRVMAGFVERQYGAELYSVMRDLKTLLDPKGIFNPGVVITDDARGYLKNLKTAPIVEEEVDRCVECGYCEPVCPSKNLTLTPRQRIVGRRVIAEAERNGDERLARRLRAEYDYEAIQTCAVDGTCLTACPVKINTGDLVRRLRQENQSKIADRAWGSAASSWETATKIASAGLSAAKVVPSVIPKAATKLGRVMLGTEHIPQYNEWLPRGGARRKSVSGNNPVAVFFPACVSAMFGPPDNNDLSASDAFLALCERAGVSVTVPEDIGSACCGTPWKSKGLASGFNTMAESTLTMLWEATDRGRLPVVSDASSCTEGLITMAHIGPRSPKGDRKTYESLVFIDSVEFIAKEVLPNLSVTQPFRSMVLHPTCSSVQLGIDSELRQVASSVAEEVVVPDSWGCCAYAGDRGMLHPELSESATKDEAMEVKSRSFDAYASLNRTCEQGMTESTGRPYRHILQHLEKATRTQ